MRAACEHYLEDHQEDNEVPHSSRLVTAVSRKADGRHAVLLKDFHLHQKPGKRGFEVISTAKFDIRADTASLVSFYRIRKVEDVPRKTHSTETCTVAAVQPKSFIPFNQPKLL